MPFLLVKWPFSAKPKVMQSCIQSKFINSVYALVHFWTKFIQYECKVHDKIIFFIFEIFDSDLKLPPLRPKPPNFVGIIIYFQAGIFQMISFNKNSLKLPHLEAKTQQTSAQDCLQRKQDSIQNQTGVPKKRQVSYQKLLNNTLNTCARFMS